MKWLRWVRCRVGIWELFRWWGNSNLSVHEAPSLLANMEFLINLISSLASNLTTLRCVLVKVCNSLVSCFNFLEVEECLLTLYLKILSSMKSGSSSSLETSIRFPFILSNCFPYRPSRRSLWLHLSTFYHRLHLKSFFSLKFHTKVFDNSCLHI